MLAISGAVICLAYILGLLLTGMPGQVGGVPAGAIGLLGTGIVSAGLVPRVWRTGVKPRVWLVAGLVGCVAGLYFQMRVPHPQTTDISHRVANASNSAVDRALVPSVQVTGNIATSPQLTQSQRIRFELNVTHAQEELETTHDKVTGKVTGKVYVTVPLLQGTELYPGQEITVTGSLYKPKPAANPGGFDFEKYLAQQGIFAGLTGQQVDLTEISSTPPLRWSIRQRIIRAQVQGLGVPEGPLVSAMVMGGRSVDVPYPIRDQFRITGLAHALAASGAQVSLIVGIVVTLTQRLSANLRLTLGCTVLLLYISLTGLEPSVVRAGVMGFVALAALTAERKVKPIASILFTATLLLLCNPLWIWDLGFQLSFLATLGLLVTVPVLTRWLDWMPNAIVPLFTVPIAAYIWTAPLLLFTFGVVSPYSILINILVSPLITIISIGGMISALAALVYPLAGSSLAWLLYYPTHLFIQIAQWGSQLPGSTWAVGTITIAQLALLYGLILMIWGWRKLHRHWWIAALAGISLVALPSWYTASHLVQATVLATADQPVWVLQARGKVALLNSGDDADAKFTVLPFLQKQGINQIDWAIAPQLPASSLAGWQRILANVPIREFYSETEANSTVEISTQRIQETQGTQGAVNADRSPLSASHQLWFTQLQQQQGTAVPLGTAQPLQLGAATVLPLSYKPAMLQIRIADQDWLLLPDRIPIEPI